MKNNFKEVMAQKPDEELLKIVKELKSDYQVEAVEAAAFELHIRNIDFDGIEEFRNKFSLLKTSQPGAIEIVNDDGFSIKCANCEKESFNPSKDKFGELFLITNSKTEFDTGSIIESPKTIHRYKGFSVEWFVCDDCAKNYHDTSGIAPTVIGVILLIIGLIIPFAVAVIVGVIAILIGFSGLSYFLKDDSYKSIYSRDMALRQAIQFEGLLNRKDFKLKHGKVRLKSEGPDSTLTRFQQEKI